MRPGNRQEALPVLDQGTSTGAERLSQYICEQATSLQGIICSYVVRSGLAQGETAWTTAAEVLNDTILEALVHAERLDSSIQPQAWLLGIASNILKRRKASLTRQQREVVVSDLHHDSSSLSAAAFFDQIAALTSPGPEHALEDQERVQEILSLVSPSDQEVLRLAILSDLDTQSLARALGVSPGAARVRLHRALNRLRLAWHSAPGAWKRGEARE